MKKYRLHEGTYFRTLKEAIFPPWMVRLADKDTNAVESYLDIRNADMSKYLIPKLLEDYVEDKVQEAITMGHTSFPFGQSKSTVV